MLMGVNGLSPLTLPLVRQLIEEGLADFCEVMADNFIHLPPEKIRSALPDVPLALHIVASRFLEKSFAELKQLAAYLRPWIHALKPIYVSDHLVRFTEHGSYLPFIAELDYDREGEHIKKRVREWKNLLDVSLLFENHASVTPRGKQQAVFFERLLQETHSDLLFDFSNAYIAEYNQIAPVTQWQPLMRHARHFHVAGFKIEPVSKLAIDTHDAPVEKIVLDRMSAYFQAVPSQAIRTLVVETDANVQLDHWRQELRRIRKVLGISKGAA
ncbi:multinuclear nonheme iron-dependent oxidase [Aquicella lusitana]|uniref:Methanobactin biosynthesis cassette protein MbnB n=1 Tax=Aquicella lusitana TaxID=254246 RepID=A0A370GP75_9COXI|nr:DUF692 family multinuclear iron-containing protein [Aquicella lusitana]RDI45159.1 methanobactin biosynthesis cassette protein MbnB [Aquicella lusitana]VVC72771.1 hypothetical protein AQULUS_04930 [Aquicella lusitana]